MRSVECSISVLCFCLFLCCTAAAQEKTAVDGFIGRGIARISGGDISGARQVALADAQLKAVIDAVNSLLPAETFAAHSTRIIARFSEQPDRYLQSFRVTGENALPDQYQVTVQAAVQIDGVRQELSDMGLLKHDRNKAVLLLVMAAQRGLDAPEELYWWSSDAGLDSREFPLQQAVEAAFADKETRIISPFEPPLKDAFSQAAGTPAPDTDVMCLLAAQTGAQVVVHVRAALTRSKAKRLVSVQNVQCDITASAIDVQGRQVVLQAVTQALGAHVDEAEACRDAMQKASRQLADQITERLYQQLRQARPYVFKLRFSRDVSPAEVRECLLAYAQVLPGLELTELEQAEGRQSWTARVTCQADNADILKKMFGSGVAGYITRITSVRENVLDVRITPIKRR
ncbi:MAG: hypothetical protein JW832_11260 [Deltaproteobacteria bacterium]|nr:hypothetical protein [Deltaproteobacteria bacterium]